MTENSLDFKLGKLITEVEGLKESVDEIKADLKGEFVRHEEFEPVKKLAYYTLGILLTAVVAEVVLLVVK
jgi:hypothetical protein